MRRRLRTMIMAIAAMSFSMLMITTIGTPAQAARVLPQCNLHWGFDEGRC